MKTSSVKSVEGQGHMVSSLVPLGDLFCGVPRSDLGISSKRPDAVPPNGFKWQFITGLWSLVPTVVLSQPSPPVEECLDSSAPDPSASVPSIPSVPD